MLQKVKMKMNMGNMIKKYCDWISFRNAKLNFIHLLLIIPKGGALDGGPPMSHVVLKDGNVICPCHLFFPMSHVKFKKRLCPMSL